VDNLIERIRASQPDLILLDVMFPENPSQGFDSCRELKNDPELKGIPVVILSAINEKYQLGFSQKECDPDFLPAEAFLEKPVDDGKLLETISGLLA